MHADRWDLRHCEAFLGEDYEHLMGSLTNTSIFEIVSLTAAAAT
jgi:hypothetical protein